MDKLEHLAVTTGPSPAASVIWLHGLGADGRDFEPIVPQLGLPSSPAVRFLFPHAPVRPVTINGGMPMRAWYDFRSLEIGRGEDPGHIEASVQAVSNLIDGERERGIAAGHICLAGFSQGGVVALAAGLAYPERLAGVLALSCYLPAGALPEGPADWPPVFMAHGTEDPVIPIGHGRLTAERLRHAGVEVEWHEYPIPHGVAPEEIEAIGRWLGRTLSA